MDQIKTCNEDRRLNLEDFAFSFPESLIAQNPLAKRDSSKLLVWDGHEATHNFVNNLDIVAPANSLFIVNNSRVIASRIHGKIATGANIELLLLEPATGASTSKECWSCIGKPMRKLKTGLDLKFDGGLQATITALDDTPSDGPKPFKVEFNLKGDQLLAWLDSHGHMPLPPYISRKEISPQQLKADKENYQTVYSQGLGSVAAPTAGLHFSANLIEKLKAKGCEFAHLTLHVGAGTFLPVKTQDPAQHMMHSERFIVPKSTYKSIVEAKKIGRPVVVVGTTALRSLEGLSHLAASERVGMEELVDTWLRTEIFIRPKHRNDRFHPWAADYLMTNFHQPQSTLFMLVCALIGFDSAHKLYAEAIRSKYRLFSYGDSSLLRLKMA